MKVQAKLLSNHYQYEVVEESSNYYIVYGTGGKVAVSKADYEPVQEWVDVTSECRFGTYCGFAGEGLEGWGYITAGYKGSVMHPDYWNKVLKLELVDGGIRVYARKGSAPW